MKKGKKFIGILIEDGGIFDETVVEYIKDLIKNRVQLMRNGDRVSQRRLAKKLEIDNNRMNRLTKALDIKELFE